MSLCYKNVEVKDKIMMTCKFPILLLGKLQCYSVTVKTTLENVKMKIWNKNWIKMLVLCTLFECLVHFFGSSDQTISKITKKLFHCKFLFILY